ncbi:cupredoxin domain-containing protein [Candidatus Acetothermia bacterium]|nr:cupredoxin domain-containing protein [Candidatus Acetothermia bacterium]MBI3661172.1 cupredoxin domain-containing protein [Candidatus Acetothermia bacterium]
MAEHKVQQQQAPQRKQIWRVYLLGLIVIVVLGTTGLLLKPMLWPDRPATIGANTVPENSQVVNVEADMGGFSMKEIRAKVGQPLTVQLTSMDSQFHMDGGGKHQWAIDELDVNIIAPSKSTAEATFTPTKPGTYEFYCNICCGGKANPSMQGKLIVES